MTDPIDRLEAELARLRPVKPSTALAARLEVRLGRPARRPPRWLAAAALAAGVALVVLAWRDPVPPPAVAARPLPPPSVAAYRAALLESPEALDALLDRQAARDSGEPAVDMPTCFSHNLD
ncbi:MAG: hypothetical protein U0736_24045 [Gemmataceae bacterium]